MAWPRSHTARDGTVTWHLTIRNPRFGEPGQKRYLPNRSLGAVTRERALAEAALARQVDEGRPPKITRLGPLDALDRFILHGETVRRWRPGMERYYRWLLSPLLVWLTERADSRLWHAGLLLDYLAMMARPHPIARDRDGNVTRTGRGWSAATQAKLIKAVRALCAWARLARVEMPEFAREIAIPAWTPVEKKPYADGELAAIRREAGRWPLRWLRLAIALASDAGLSLGDLRTIPWTSIDFDDWMIRHDRREKTRRCIEVPKLTIPLTPYLRAVLLAERATHGPICSEMPESDSAVSQAWHRLCRRAGVDATGGLKRLRHTWITNLGLRKTDPETLSRLGGWTKRSTQFKRYLHTNEGAMREAIDSLAKPLPRPRARKRA